MSVSEQQVQGRIAEARESLRSIRASLRTGTVVRLLGLVVGLIIVGIYVSAFLGLGKRVLESGQMREQLQRRWDMIRTQESLNAEGLEQVLRQVGPVYAKEARAALKELDITSKLREQAQLAFEDIRPVLLKQFERVRPRVTSALEAEMDTTLEQIDTRLTNFLEDRLAQMIREQETSVRRTADVTEQEVAEILANVITANQEALKNVVEKRWRKDKQELYRMRELVAQFPPLPEMSEDEMLQQTFLVLMGLLKHKLPAYQFSARLEIPPAEAERREAPSIPWQKIPGEYREKVREALGPSGEETGVPWDKIPEEYRDEVRKAFEEQEAGE